MPARSTHLVFCNLLLLLGASPARTQESPSQSTETPTPSILQEQLPLQKDSAPPSPYQQRNPRRIKKIPSLLDQFDSIDEEATPEERAKLRKEDRDRTLAEPPPVSGPESNSLRPDHARPGLLTPAEEPNDAVSDRPEPRWNPGTGRAQLYGGGSQLQTMISGFRVEHTFWESFTLAGRAEGEVDLLRSANNYSAAGELSWRLFRPFSISVEGGAGGASFVNWVGGGGSATLLLSNLFDQDIDTRFSVRAASRSGTLGSLDATATLLGFSTVTYGASLSQDLGESVTAHFEFDVGSSVTASGVTLASARIEQDISVQQEGIHLALAAISRRYAPFEGSFASTRWQAGLGLRITHDFRLAIEAGQILSELADPTLASWWIFHPRFEIDLGPRTALQLDAIWAPHLDPTAAANPVLPSDLILGRVGVRLLWP
jgi:hypothetical protein